MTSTVAPTTHDYCLTYKPIFDSTKDTQETQDQVTRENGKFECICNHNCPNPVSQ